MTKIPLVPSSAIWPFLGFLDGIGASTGRFLADAGLTENVFESAENLVPLPAVTRLVELAARTEGADLGLEVGRRTTLEQFGELGRLSLSSDTIGRAARYAELYCGLYNPGLQARATVDGNVLTWQQWHPRQFGNGYLQLDAYVLMMTIQQIRRWVDALWMPLELRVDPELVGEIRRIGDLSDCRIIPANGLWQIRTESRLLSYRIPGGRPLPDQVAVLSRLRASSPPRTLVPIIRELVRTYLTAGQPTVIQLARLLETSPRTLQRRLADEGTSLTAIIDDERRTRALAAVIDSSRTVVDTAMICGYTDPANFTRAFRRWTGMSPLEFRRLSILN